MTTDTAGRLSPVEEAILQSLALVESPGVELGTVCTRLAYFRIVDDYLSVHRLILNLIQQQYIAVNHQRDRNWYVLAESGLLYYDSYLQQPG